MTSGLTREMPAYRRLALAMLVAGFSTFALLYTVQPLLPVFAREFGIDAARASLTVSLTTGPMALALIPVGILSDRVGRRPLMIAALFGAAALTAAAAIVPGWPMLLASRLLMGLALAGIPAVAMTYVAEEVAPEAMGAAIGLYISGTAIGGMCGRLGSALIADFLGWRAAMGGIGLLGLGAAIAFVVIAPPSRRFVARRDDPRALAAGIGRLARDAAMPWLYLAGFLLMGTFVTVYNYVGFRLMAPPYSLPQSVIGAIFLLYLAGSISSTGFGTLAGRIGRRKVLWGPIALMLAGALLTLAEPLWLVVLGIAFVTVGFFGSHSIASGWVGRRAGEDRALGAAGYMSCYYLGSSILGSLGGVAWTHWGWPGVTGFVGALSLLAMLVAFRLAAVQPLPVPEATPEEELPPG